MAEVEEEEEMEQEEAEEEENNVPNGLELEEVGRNRSRCERHLKNYPNCGKQLLPLSDQRFGPSTSMFSH